MKKIIVVTSLLFLSCTEQNKFDKILTTKSDSTFWIRKVEDKKGNYIYINSQLVFFENHKMMSFNSFEENKLGNRSVLNMEGSNEENWTYNEKDSIFKICAVCIYKIDKYSKDTIFMNNRDNGEKFILIRKPGYTK